METYPAEWQVPANVTEAAKTLYGFPRISQPAFTAAIACTLAFNVLVWSYRTWFRLHYFKKLYADDWILLYVMCALATGNGLTLWFRQGTYFGNYATLGLLKLDDHWAKYKFGVLWIWTNNAANIVLYSAIFGVKLSYLTCTSFICLQLPLLQAQSLCPICNRPKRSLVSAQSIPEKQVRVTGADNPKSFASY